jgi:hypothetical protein
VKTTEPEPARRRIVPPPPPPPQLAGVHAALNYESPQPKRSRLKRAWLMLKYRYEGPIGNVLASAFVVALVILYLLLRYASYARLRNGR